MKVFIFNNYRADSVELAERIKEIINRRGYVLANEYEADVDLIICIGGDGTFLSCAHKCALPSAPIIGVNTGHLGFFQDITPDAIESIFDDYEADRFTKQTIYPVEAKIYTERDTYMRTGINEIMVRGPYSHASQFTISIGKTKIQDFSGDGVMISTPVGSTAYNYSLGGSIVSPNLNVLQLTPVAPMNTNAYRSFHSSIILPADDTITLETVRRTKSATLMVAFDGRTHEFNNVDRIEIVQSSSCITILRLESYDYWEKLKNKLV